MIIISDPISSQKPLFISGNGDNKADIELLTEEIFNNDPFKRIDKIKTLMSIIESEKNKKGLVVFINGEWGSGKTIFINLWQKYLDTQNYKFIHFNAWENDIHAEAFNSIINELVNVLPRKLKRKNKTTISKIESIKSLSSTLFIKKLPLLVSALIVGLAKSNLGADFTEIFKEILTEFSVDTTEDLTNAFVDFNEKIYLDELETLNKSKSNLDILKKTLKDYINSLKLQNGKLYFFIDELDRCRPDYAIEVLEKVKHFFSIENIVFVFSIDRIALSKSFSTIYGNNFNADGYLARFYDLEYDLPTLDSLQLVNMLSDKYDFSETDNAGKNKYIKQFFEYFFNIYSVPVRIADKIFSKLHLIFSNNIEMSSSKLIDNKYEYTFYINICFLVTIKYSYYEGYNNIKNNHNLTKANPTDELFRSSIYEHCRILYNGTLDSTAKSFIVLYSFYYNRGLNLKSKLNTFNKDIEHNGMEYDSYRKFTNYFTNSGSDGYRELEDSSRTENNNIKSIFKYSIDVIEKLDGFTLNR